MLPGGTATLLLADLGARVIKIENPVGGDEIRSLAPKVGADSSAQHQYMDRGKESVRADLRTAAGRQLVLDLVAGADAVIESYRPGVADRIGVGFAQAAAVKADIVYLSLSGYGQSGPRAGFAGHDLNFMAYAGLVDSLPMTLQADVAGGMLAALGLVAAISQAGASGRAVHIELALADAALVVGGMQISERLAALTLDRPISTPLDGNSPCYQIYRCGDGRLLSVAAVEPKFWAAVMTAIGRPEWISRRDDPLLIDDVAAVFAAEPLSHWTALLETADTCVSPVVDTGQLLADTHLIARNSLIECPTVEGPLWQVGAPLRDVTPIDLPLSPRFGAIRPG